MKVRFAGSKHDCVISQIFCKSRECIFNFTHCYLNAVCFFLKSFRFCSGDAVSEGVHIASAAKQAASGLWGHSC